MSASNDKVIAPGVSTRIEQCRHCARAGIDAREVRPFVRVAAVAGKREVRLTESESRGSMAANAP